MLVRRSSTLILIIALLSLPVACSRQANETSSREIQIAGAGATFPHPLYKSWIQEYQKVRPDIAISYEAVGSGEGVRKFLNQEIDFGASDAAMSDEEMAKVERGTKLIPATAGIVVLAYHVNDVGGGLKLTRDVYVDIFRGKIKKWDDPRIKQVNPGARLPGLEIIPVVRADSSGTTYAFTNHLSAISKDWRDLGPGIGKLVQWPLTSMAARGNEGVAGRIKITDGAIGYVEYGFARRAGLPMAAVENKAGKFIDPSPARGQATLINTRDDMPPNRRLFFPDPPGEDSYPLVTYSWLLLYGSYPDPMKGEALKDFVEWGLTDGQKLSEGLGFCRLPARIGELGVQDLNAIK